MQVILKKLTLKNFKGVQNQEINFDPKSTFIFGRNGAGKSTLEDAWSWLITGKDREGNQKFGIKPTDAAGKTTDKLDNEVTAVIDVDGREYSMRMVHREKWVKPRGNTEENYEGNEILYYWQESASTGLVKVNKGVYFDEIDKLIPKERLSLLSNVRSFLNKDKKERRAILIALAGEINFQEMLEKNPKFASIGDILEEPSRLLAAKKYISQQISDAKKKLAEENTRIDENRTRIGGLQRPFDRLRTDLIQEKDALAKLDAAINDKSKAYEEQDKLIAAKRKERQDAQTMADAIVTGLRTGFIAKGDDVDDTLVALEKESAVDIKALNELNDEVANIESDIKKGTDLIAGVKEASTNFESVKANFRLRWSENNASSISFSEEEFCCPTCNRELDPEDRMAKESALKENFNNAKAAKTQALNEEAARIKKESAEIEEKLQKYEVRLKELQETLAAKNELKVEAAQRAEASQSKLSDYKSQPKKEKRSIDDLVKEALAGNQEHADYLKKVSTLSEEIDNVKPIDNAELIEQRKPILVKIDELNKELADELQIKDAEKRIAELTESAKQLAQQIADNEKKEHLIAEFDRMRMDEVEARVNSLFKLVKFQMFSVQENGEIVDDCLIMCEGKSYDRGQWNSALTINCGIDIINTFSKSQDVYLPIMVDNRESTTDIIASQSQIINLVVSPADKVLRIEHETPTAAKPAEQPVQGSLI